VLVSERKMGANFSGESGIGRKKERKNRAGAATAELLYLQHKHNNTSKFPAAFASLQQ